MMKALVKQVPALDALISQRHSLLSKRRERLLRKRHPQRELYLGLLVKTLTNTIYGDPSIRPKQTGYDPKLRETGSDWPSVAHTMVGVVRLTNLKQLTQRTIDECIPGDYIETGVWRGGCCILMRAVLEANQIRDRKVYVADSFAGLPPPKPDQYPVDAGDIFHTYRQLAIPIEQVRSNFATYGLLDDQVVFVPGFFQDTLPSLEAGLFALIRLDGDMYESTIVALNSLYPKLSPGGFVIIDDYDLHGCRAAVDDFRRDHGITSAIKFIDGAGIWWRKSRVSRNSNP
jgi:O-methyltransferase/8-demethyl-8-(2,3-dimethoxy-alpha-L-rhamnosyl)tetracenomycin-C 4'-O-methyltransferase